MESPYLQALASVQIIVTTTSQNFVSILGCLLTIHVNFPEIQYYLYTVLLAVAFELSIVSTNYRIPDDKYKVVRFFMYAYFLVINLIKTFTIYTLLSKHETSIDHILYTILFESIFVSTCVIIFVFIKSFYLKRTDIAFYRTCLTLLSGFTPIDLDNKKTI